MFPTTDPVSTKAWQSLMQQFEAVKDSSISSLFEHDKNRFSSFSIFHGDILFDYSKNNISEETRYLLLQLCEECNVKSAIEAMFNGEKINATENRAVLHTALRNFTAKELLVDGKNIIPGINAVLQQIKDFSRRINSGEWKGYTGKKIINVVNIGIGGSDLGPVMVTEALKPYWLPGIKTFFVSNVDATHLTETIKSLSAPSLILLRTDQN